MTSIDIHSLDDIYGQPLNCEKIEHKESELDHICKICHELGISYGEYQTLEYTKKKK